MFETKLWKRQKTLKNVIRNEIRCSRRYINISDKHLDPISDKDMGAFLTYNNTEKSKYRDEIWDCNNFALQLAAAAQRYFAPKGINCAVGIIWTNKHAFNISVNTEFKVRLWEPQTDKRCFLDGRVKLIVI